MHIFDRIAKARIKLVLDHPFYGCIAMRFELKERPEIQTMATDGPNLYYNEPWVMALSDEELVGVIAHEAMHVILMHNLRIGGRDIESWNVACDYAINIGLDNFVLPKGGLIDQKYLGMTAEEIHDTLPEEEKKNGQGWGYVMAPKNEDGTAMSPSQVKVMEEELKSELAAAAAIAKKQGKLPENIARLVGELISPQVNWKEKLRLAVVGLFPLDYTWSKYSRRMLDEGMYMPTLRKEGAGDIAIAIDTSGSIGKTELTAFFSELNCISEEVAPQSVTVMYIDAAVSSVDRFEAGETITAKPTGGGGTDFRPAFDWIKKNGSNPQALIYFTDMYGDFPKSPPDYPVIWVSTSGVKTAPFGDVIQIKV